MALNSIVLQGRLVRDPDLRSTGSGKRVCAFTVAVDRGRTPGTDFINCAAWEKDAEFISKYFFKGDLILVQGQLQTRQYEDRNGSKRTAYEVVVREVNFCGGKKRDEPANALPAVGKESPFEPIMDEYDVDGELPF